MSAAHLAEKDNGLRRVASDHRAEAVSRLEREILGTCEASRLMEPVPSGFNSVVLFTCILLGMTDVRFINFLGFKMNSG
jgi:hypothetical protein